VNEFLTRHALVSVAIVKIAVLLFITVTVLAYLSWFERKVIAHIQSRWGPFRAGPHGLLQPLADGLKFLFKEDVTPRGVDPLVYYLAPFLALALALASIALIPFGPTEFTLFGHRTRLVVADLNIGLLFIFAITALSVYGVALAGWSSNSKYSLLGGLRSSAQMISYELSLTMSIVGVLLMAGTFSLREVVEAQRGHALGFLPRWNLIAAPLPQIIGFFCYFTSAVAETNRLPFDLPEAEGELVAGYHTEYASFKFAMFFMAEYCAMLTVACLATVLFFGGWLSPLPERAPFTYLPAVAFAAGGLYLLIDGVRKNAGYKRVVLCILGLICLLLSFLFAQAGAIEVVQGPFWFLSKVFLFLFVYVWVRGTLPRFRYDQLMNFGWKLLLPASLLNVALTSFAILVGRR
jgi:NADH-quinone oxidoreductase subunit H